MKRLLKNKKALSPVVAAIILIAVTVAVSIAVAAWMGSLTIGFMETSEMTINQIAFDVTNDEMNVTITNSGTSDFTVGMLKVNGNTIASTDFGRSGDDASEGLTFATGDTGYIEIDYSTYASGVVSGNKYSVNFFAPDGTLIGSFTDTA